MLRQTLSRRAVSDTWTVLVDGKQETEKKQRKYQGVKEFHMLARIGCFKNYGFQSF